MFSRENNKEGGGIFSFILHQIIIGLIRSFISTIMTIAILDLYYSLIKKGYNRPAVYFIVICCNIIAVSLLLIVITSAMKFFGINMGYGNHYGFYY